VLLFAPMAACGQDAAPAGELGVPHDLGADLSAASTPDLGPSCAGTRIAGTCVERFFQPFMACFAPGGRCGEFGRGSVCWESGAKYELAYPGLSASWSMNGHACLGWNEITQHEQYCTSESSPCTVEHSVDDGGAYHYWTVGGGLYDRGTGIFTCPDGTQVNLGNDFGGCPALNALLGARCDRNDWSCP
jgi:hypothetical protein